jgi:hypothetical protein
MLIITPPMRLEIRLINVELQDGRVLNVFTIFVLQYFSYIHLWQSSLLVEENGAQPEKHNLQHITENFSTVLPSILHQ